MTVTDDLPVRPQHTRRSGDQIVDDLRANLGRLVESVRDVFDIAVLIDSDLKEIYERGLYRTVWGYKSFKDFAAERLGMEPRLIRARLLKVYKAHRLVIDGVLPPGSERLPHHLGSGPRLPRRRALPRPVGSPDPILASVRTADADGSQPEAAGAESEHPETVDPLVAQLVTVLLDLAPETLAAEATEDQAAVVMDWWERLVLIGRRLGFCEHHPDARSDDGTYCTACERQVRR